MSEPETLDIRVAKVLDKRKIVINRGASAKLSIGQRFIVYERGDEVIDPVTGESLGNLEVVKGKGAAVHVQEKMAIIQMEEPERGPSRTLSEIMASISGKPDEPEILYTINVGDLVKPEA